MSGTVTVAGLSASEIAGERILGPLSIQGTTVVGDTQSMALASGDNTVSIPAGSVGVVIIPPPLGVAVLKYRTNLNPGDTGLPISPSAPFMHVFPPTPPTSVIVNSSASQAAFMSFWVW